MPVQKQRFGHTPDGVAVDLYVLTNRNGLTVTLTSYGAAVVAIHAPDRHGTLADIVLGHDTLEGFLDAARNPYFGCVVGRYANRIASGRFHLNGVDYQLAVNNNGNHLHGGLCGFDKAVWESARAEAEGASSVAFSYLSRDGEEYTVTPDGDTRFVVFYVDGMPSTVVNASPYKATMREGAVTAKAYARYASKTPVVTAVAAPATR